jgi:hypothetical protein
LSILVVETDLVLDTQDQDFDAKPVDSLVAKIREFARANKIDGVDIIPVMD